MIGFVCLHKLVCDAWAAAPDSTTSMGHPPCRQLFDTVATVPEGTPVIHTVAHMCRQLFDTIAGAPEGTAFTVKAQFLEIYNEELRDLLTGYNQGRADPNSSPQHSPGPACSGSPSKQRSIAIRECADGQIMVTGEHMDAC